MAAYYGIIIFILGLVWGSFLNCMAIRITKKEDWVRGRSHCTTCSHTLSARDLIPVISYISTGGKCRYCGQKISVRYPATELVFAVFITIMYLFYGVPVINAVFGTAEISEGLTINIALFIRNTAFTGALFVVSLVDLDSLEIPDHCLIFSIAVWIVTIPFIADGGIKGVFISSIKHIGTAALVMIAMLLISCVMDFVLKKESLGGGDIKLFAVCALYLGPFGSYELILFSCIAGLIFNGVRCIVMKKSGIKNTKKEFPFGPSIAITAYFLLIFETYITNWYFSLL